MNAADRPITELLRRFNGGDRSVWQELVPYVYDDLRRLAHQRMRNERDGHTFSTTALVNECYLRLVENPKLAAEDRGEFMALVSQTMRRLLVDYANALLWLPFARGDRGGPRCLRQNCPAYVERRACLVAEGDRRTVFVRTVTNLDPVRWERVIEAFTGALERTHGRERYLMSVLGDDPLLLAEVHAMLALTNPWPSSRSKSVC